MAKDVKTDKEKKGSTSMVAPHPLGTGKKAAKDLRPVEELAEEAELKPWEAAGLMRASGWASGKQVTRTEFDKALSAFRDRPLGGGRLSA